MRITDKWMFLGAIAVFTWALGNAAGWLQGTSSFVLLLFVIWLVFEVADSGAKQTVRKEWLDVIKNRQKNQERIQDHRPPIRMHTLDG